MHCIGRQTVEQTLSLFGSSVVQYAILWYLVLRSNSGMVMTVAMVAAALPQAIVSVFGGVWADRWKRKTVGHVSRCRHRGRDHMPVGKYGCRLG